MATINEIITKNFESLLSKCNCDKVISEGKTDCDLLQDVCIRALRKFKEKEIDDDYGLNYLSMSLRAAMFFQKKRIGSDIISYVDNVEDLGV